MQLNQSDEFEIIISDNIESLKNQLAELYSKNEILTKELQSKETQILEMSSQITNYKKNEAQDQFAKNSKSKDQQNDIAMQELKLNQQRLHYQQIENLKKELQQQKEQNLKKGNLTSIEQENAILKQQNSKFSEEIKQLRDKLGASELKLKQQMDKLKEKEQELIQIFDDIEKQKNFEIEQKIKQYQKQKDQEIEILRTTQKKLIQQYEKKIIDSKLTSQVFFQNDQNKLNPMQAIFQEIESLIKKHIDDLEGRRQVIDFIDQKTNIKDMYKRDLEEVQNSLVQINNFLKNNS